MSERRDYNNVPNLYPERVESNAKGVLTALLSLVIAIVALGLIFNFFSYSSPNSRNYGKIWGSGISSETTAETVDATVDDSNADMDVTAPADTQDEAAPAETSEGDSTELLPQQMDSTVVSIPEGTYYISTALSTSYVLEAAGGEMADGTNVQLASQTSTAKQVFRVVGVGDGWYEIINYNSGTALDVVNGSAESGTNVQIYSENGSDAQRWRFHSGDNGYYLENALGCYLEVPSGEVAEGTNIWVYSANGETAQQWQLTQADVNALTDAEYVFPDSSSRLLTTQDMEGKSAWELRVGRNEIYARYGRMFDDEELQNYFDSKSWYSGTIAPSDFSENELNDIERQNTVIITDYEKEMGYR